MAGTPEHLRRQFPATPVQRKIGFRWPNNGQAKRDRLVRQLRTDVCVCVCVMFENNYL